MKFISLLLLSSVTALAADESRIQSVEPSLSDVNEYADLSQKNFYKYSIEYNAPKSVEVNIESNYPPPEPRKTINLGKLQKFTILLYWPSEEQAIDKEHGVNIISYSITSPTLKERVYGAFGYYNTHLCGVGGNKEKDYYTIFGLERSGPFTGMNKKAGFTITFISKAEAEQGAAANP